MEFFQFIFGLFQYFGITAEKVGPFVVLGFALYAALSTKQRSTEKALSKVNRQAENIRNAVYELQAHIAERDKKKLIHALDDRIDTWSTAKSPLELNDAGEQLLRASGMRGVVQENMHELLDDLKETDPQTAYDVQQNSYLVLYDFVEDNQDVQNILKEFLFEKPKFLDRKIDLEDLVYVGLFPLRDRYLRENKELNSKNI